MTSIVVKQIIMRYLHFFWIYLIYVSNVSIAQEPATTIAPSTVSLSASVTVPSVASTASTPVVSISTLSTIPSSAITASTPSTISPTTVSTASSSSTVIPVSTDSTSSSASVSSSSSTESSTTTISSSSSTSSVSSTTPSHNSGILLDERRCPNISKIEQMITFGNPSSCSSYYVCLDGNAYLVPCEDNTLWNEKFSRCLPTTSCIFDPPVIIKSSWCSIQVNFNVPIFFSCPRNKNYFYKCELGVAVRYRCPSGLQWDRKNERCNYVKESRTEDPKKCDYNDSCDEDDQEEDNDSSNCS